MLPALLEEYLEELDTIDLCSWSQLYAESVFRRILFYKSITRSNLHEDSITQDLIYRFWRLAHNREHKIQVHQAIREPTNGNDFEICIQTPKGFILMPCQAKILCNNSRYETLNHKNQRGFQINLLIAYAKGIGGIPIYFLYNHCSDPTEFQYFREKHGFDIDQLGCSIFPAKYIQRRYFDPPEIPFIGPGFRDLHHYLAIPFAHLFCHLWRIIEEMGDQNANDINYYPKDEVIKKGYWRNLRPPAAIGRISPGEDNLPEFNPNIDSNLDFSPRFRILLISETDSTTLKRFF